MDSGVGGSLPPGVAVIAACPEQEPVLANLLELYAHDFSEWFDLRLRPDGRFGYPSLPLYWQEQGRWPFLVTVDGYLAGLALVSTGSRIDGDPRVLDMAEFFIVRGYRKRGIGAAVAHEVGRRLPGRWEVRVLEGNHPARAFWAAAVAAFTGSAAEARTADVQGKRWHLFAFVAPPPGVAV
jgi:predicted acetyltransferase